MLKQTIFFIQLIRFIQLPESHKPNRLTLILPTGIIPSNKRLPLPIGLISIKNQPNKRKTPSIFPVPLNPAPILIDKYLHDKLLASHRVDIPQKKLTCFPETNKSSSRHALTWFQLVLKKSVVFFPSTFVKHRPKIIWPNSNTNQKTRTLPTFP